MQTNLLAAPVYRATWIFAADPRRKSLLSIFNHLQSTHTHTAHAHIRMRFATFRCGGGGGAHTPSDSCRAKWTCFMHKCAITFAKVASTKFHLFLRPIWDRATRTRIQSPVSRTHTSAPGPEMTEKWVKPVAMWPARLPLKLNAINVYGSILFCNNESCCVRWHLSASQLHHQRYPLRRWKPSARKCHERARTAVTQVWLNGYVNTPASLSHTHTHAEHRQSNWRPQIHANKFNTRVTYRKLSLSSSFQIKFYLFFFVAVRFPLATVHCVTISDRASGGLEESREEGKLLNRIHRRNIKKITILCGVCDCQTRARETRNTQTTNNNNNK